MYVSQPLVLEPGSNTKWLIDDPRTIKKNYVVIVKK